MTATPPASHPASPLIRHNASRWACALALIASAFGPVAQAQGVCFAPTDRAVVPVLENAPPPSADGQRDYAYYPASAIASMRLDALIASRSTLPKYYWQWANHGPRKVEKGNIAPGVIGQVKAVAVDFSSSASADACTLAQTATALGAADAAAGYARRGGLTLQATVPENGEVRDVCIVPRQVLSGGLGVLLDYEVQDNRSPAETAEFLSQYASLVHSAHRNVILYTNPLDAPGQRRTGLDGSNIVQVAGAFDNLTVLLWSRNREGDIAASYRAQKAMLQGVPAAKTIVVFELANTTLQDAATVNRILVQDRPAALMFWRDNAAQGGPCSTPVNQKIACAAFGRCSG